MIRLKSHKIKVSELYYLVCWSILFKDLFRIFIIQQNKFSSKKKVDKCLVVFCWFFYYVIMSIIKKFSYVYRRKKPTKICSIYLKIKCFRKPTLSSNKFNVSLSKRIKVIKIKFNKLLSNNFEVNYFDCILIVFYL